MHNTTVIQVQFNRKTTMLQCNTTYTSMIRSKHSSTYGPVTLTVAGGTKPEALVNQEPKLFSEKK